MGIGKFFKKLGHTLKEGFKQIGKGLKKAAKGFLKFAKSPLGQVLLGIGLAALTLPFGGFGAAAMLGGTAARLAATLGPRLAALVPRAGSLLTGRLGSAMAGRMAGVTKGFATKFMSRPESMLSQSGLTSSANLLKTVSKLESLKKFGYHFSNMWRSSQQKPNAASAAQAATISEAAQYNLQQMIAFFQARMMRTPGMGMIGTGTGTGTD